MMINYEMKPPTILIGEKLTELHTQIFKDILNCRAIMVEGYGKSLRIDFDLVYTHDYNFVYRVSVIDEHENMFNICSVQLSPSKFTEATKAQVIVNIKTDIELQFKVPYKNFKVVIDANYFCKEELLKSKIKNLHIDGKRIYPSLSPRSSIVENAMSGSKLLSIGYDKNSLMDIQFKSREQMHNKLYMYGVYGTKDYQTSLAPQAPLDCSDLTPYNERSFIVKQLKARPQSSNDYYLNLSAMDYLNLIEPQINHQDVCDAIVSAIKSIKKPMQHKHPTFNKETTIMQTPTTAMPFPPVTYSVTTGFLALPNMLKDVHFKTLLESFTDEHALDFLGHSGTIFDQIGAYVDMVRDEKLVHPSVKSLSKVVTFSFCRECLNEYTILAVEYLNDEYKKLANVDYDFINITSTHTEGKEELVKAFVKKYKRNPGALPAKAPKVLLKPRVSKAKEAAVSNIYSGAIVCYLDGKVNVASKISDANNSANNGTPVEFKRYASSFDKDTSDKLMAIYRKSI